MSDTPSSAIKSTVQTKIVISNLSNPIGPLHWKQSSSSPGRPFTLPLFPSNSKAPPSLSKPLSPPISKTSSPPKSLPDLPAQIVLVLVLVFNSQPHPDRHVRG